MDQITRAEQESWNSLLSKSTTDGCGRLQVEHPTAATDEEVAYIESLVPRIETGLLELRDAGTGEVVFSCQPSLTGEAVNLTH